MRAHGVQGLGSARSGDDCSRRWEVSVFICTCAHTCMSAHMRTHIMPRACVHKRVQRRTLTPAPKQPQTQTPRHSLQSPRSALASLIAFLKMGKRRPNEPAGTVPPWRFHLRSEWLQQPDSQLSPDALATLRTATNPQPWLACGLCCVMACPGHEGRKQDVPAYLGVVVTVGGTGLLARAAKAPVTAEDPRFSPPLLSQIALPQSLGKFRPCTKGWAAAPQRLFPPTCHVGLGRGVCPPPGLLRSPSSSICQNSLFHTGSQTEPRQKVTASQNVIFNCGADRSHYQPSCYTSGCLRLLDLVNSRVKPPLRWVLTVETLGSAGFSLTLTRGAVSQGLRAPGMTQLWAEGPRPCSPASSWATGETRELQGQGAAGQTETQLWEQQTVRDHLAPDPSEAICPPGFPNRWQQRHGHLQKLSCHQKLGLSFAGPWPCQIPSLGRPMGSAMSWPTPAPSLNLTRPQELPLAPRQTPLGRSLCAPHGAPALPLPSQRV